MLVAAVPKRMAWAATRNGTSVSTQRSSAEHEKPQRELDPGGLATPQAPLSSENLKKAKKKGPKRPPEHTKADKIEQTGPGMPPEHLGADKNE